MLLHSQVEMFACLRANSEAFSVRGLSTKRLLHFDFTIPLYNFPPHEIFPQECHACERGWISSCRASTPLPTGKVTETRFYLHNTASHSVDLGRPFPRSEEEFGTYGSALDAPVMQLSRKPDKMSATAISFDELWLNFCY